jgi:uncharacterized repeat protein (TIGR01451 family)
MARTLRIGGALACALMTALPVPAAAQAPRTISNTATIEWELGSSRFSQSSNTVDIIVSPPPRQASLQTWKVSASGDSISVSLDGARCGGPGLFAEAAAAGTVVAASYTPPSRARIERTTEIRAGELLVLKVEHASAGRDPSSPDTLEVTIVAANGDREKLTLVESGDDSGLFVGAIATAQAPSAASPLDCRLTVAAGEEMSIDAFEGLEDTAFASTQLRVTGQAQADDAVLLSKEASAAEAMPGGAVQYRIALRNADPRLPTAPLTLTDRFPAAMRLRPGSVRLDGAPAVFEIAPEGRGFTLAVAAIAGGGEAQISYTLEIRPDAREGDAVNRAEAVDANGVRSNIAEAAVRIRRDTIAGRMTIVGRVVEGGCAADPATAKGMAGVRIMLEDGSYTVTDGDGRYHFEGVVPGTHVVQLDDATLPADRAAVDCAQNTRSAGRAFSRFVEGRGGALKRVDFRAAEVAPRRNAVGVAATRAAPATDAAAGRRRARLVGRPGSGRRVAVPGDGA